MVNTSLFNLCFWRRVRRRGICQVCLCEQHTAERCPRRVLAVGGRPAYSAAVHQGMAYVPAGIPPSYPSSPPRDLLAFQCPAWKPMQVSAMQVCPHLLSVQSFRPWRRTVHSSRREQQPWPSVGIGGRSTKMWTAALDMARADSLVELCSCT